MAWLSTGDRKYLDLATDDYLQMPDVTAIDPKTGQPFLWGHLTEIGFARDYLLLRSHLTPEKDAERQRRLKLLGDRMAGNCRLGDIDMCETYVAYWKILDRFLGTDYLQRPAVLPIAAWVDRFYTPDTFAGGPRDASSFYEQSTCQLRCWAAAIYGKDIFPWFDAWAREHARWLPMSVGHKYEVAAAWGDQQGDGGGKVWPYHRLHLCFLLAGLGYDTDGQLVSLGNKLIGKVPAAGDATTVYPYGAHGFQLVADPAQLLTAPHVPLQDGLHIAAGIGTTVLRERDSYIQTHLSNTLRADGSAIETEDHHFRGGWAHFAWQHQGQSIVVEPHGYGIGGLEFFNLNAPCLKCQGWFWKRRFLGTEPTATGFITRGEMFGPEQTYWQSIPPHQWTEAKAFDGCKIVSAIEYDRTAPLLRVAESWFSPGNTFPEWTAELPVYQRCQHALGKITLTGSALTWTVGGQRVWCTYAMTDRHGNAVAPKVVIEPEPRRINEQDYWRAFIQSPPNLANGSLSLTFTLAAPSPDARPPSPDSPPLQLRIRTLPDGSRELFVPLP